MKCPLVAALYADFGIVKILVGPRVLNGNPSSGSQFKTLECRLALPEYCGSLGPAPDDIRDFIGWYNYGSLTYLTPYEAHHGLPGESSQNERRFSRWRTSRT